MQWYDYVVPSMSGYPRSRPLEFVEKYKDPAYRNQFRFNMAGAPFLGDFYRWEDSMQWYKDYGKNMGISWADMKYPALQRFAGSLGAGIGSSAGASWMFSRNLARMYGEYQPDKRHDWRSDWSYS